MNEQTSETHKITSRKASRKAWSHFSIKTQEFKTGYSKVMELSETGKSIITGSNCPFADQYHYYIGWLLFVAPYN